jgi:hypothetical protein
MLNAHTSPTFSGADYSVIGRGQAYAIRYAPGKVGSAKAQAGAELLGVRSVCDGMDDTRSNGTANSNAGLVG